jgi:dihydrofolate reductase/thymidylate synthase
MQAIVAACSNNLGIGIRGKLPWHLPADLKRFKELTLGHVVVMGRKTWESLPEKARPLPGRTNVVLTSNPDQIQFSSQLPADTQVVATEMKEFLMHVLPQFYNRQVFVIGGASVLQALCHRIKYVYLTHLEKHFECDTFFDIPWTYELTSFSQRFNENGLSYRFLEYKYNSHKSYHDEWSYISVARDILDVATKKPARPERTGFGTYSTFGKRMRFDISQTVPLLTTKRLPWKGCVEELLWFLRGDTDNKILQDRGVHIWDGNSTKEFQEAVGLGHLREGDCGANYSFQWRHFGAKYVDCQTDYTGQGIDQIENVLHLLRTDPFSRRIFFSAWNPVDLKATVLPPCHVSAQFYVEEDEEGKRHLSCQMYQRSADFFLGEPWNILSYSILTYILAMKTEMQPKELFICIGDTHVYTNHISQMQEQMERIPRPFPKLILNPEVKNKDWKDISIDDFDLVGYIPHPVIKAPMNA